ncbi:TetR/AcrR family transcriptional regulator [Nocardia africana]|uniref:Transcriptional regulator BetI n=1 Tax=Nocardia africana TaxID=134964 RepID=A0A378WUK7_9NOCA|nr:TetR/AcrR family transcriptional regulator [Nocardia africana]MCC3313719.1 TetR/AcrR family transcriptional regulator [Nocardia africana]SUA44898.1 transcriptional regulator BetI [Nocardia africana]
MARLAVADRRALLLAAAARVIARVGIADLTTRTITAEAGMPQGIFHYCFRSKNELLAELITTTVAELVDLSSVVDLVTDDLDATIRGALRHMWQSIVEPADKQLALYELTVYALRDPELADLARRQYEGYFRASTRLLDTIAQRAGIRWTVPVPSLARTLVSVIDGLGLNWLADKDSDAALAVLDTYASQLAAMAKPSP